MMVMRCGGGVRGVVVMVMGCGGDGDEVRE